jgi:HD-like signal output (HDOD) protein/AmiR/NasT family two-component response regulator
MHATHIRDLLRLGAETEPKRVLFVDDETHLLDALRLNLRSRETQWRPRYVESGARAIAEMEHEPVDAVVTDMRMPGMDGAELLRIVSVRWPETIRIVLSGHAEMQQIKSLVPIAHQYLAKPCDPISLENTVERCLQLQALLRRPQLRAVVGRVRKLPAIPRTYSMLKALIANEDVETTDVATVIATDSAIAAKVLQLVNSAFFGLSRRMTSIQHAVTFLGFGAICNVVLSAEVFSQWNQVSGSSALDVERLQLHARTVAAAGHALTEKTAIADDVVLAGLLHDIGYWVLAQECPNELAEAVEVAASRGIPLVDAEVEVIGASHAAIGAYLLGIWGLPFSVVEAVAHHHAPWNVKQTSFDVLAATSVAHALTGLGDVSAFNEALVPDEKVNADYLEAVNAPFDWSAAERRVAESLKSEESLF